MLLFPDHKSELAEPIRDGHDKNAADLPPSYDDASSPRPSASNAEKQCASSSSCPDSVAGPSSGPSFSHDYQLTFLSADKKLPLEFSPNDTPSSSKNTKPPRRLRSRKRRAWLSLLPFASSLSAKRVRQSVLSIVTDLVAPTSHLNRGEQKDMQNAHEILGSLAEECAEHKVSLSTMLQETFIADHTPMYWAVVNYRQELLVALLVHSRPLSIQTISDIRRACLASANQALFHALRVCRPPFHRTDGIQVPNLRAVSNNLLLDNRPVDEIHVQHTSDSGFVVSFDIPLWQRRIRVVGQVSIEFIASGRMWSITFFSADPSLRQTANTWHVMVGLLESSPPTFFDSQLVVDVPGSRPVSTDSIPNTRLRETRSTIFLSPRDGRDQSQLTLYDYNYDEKAHLGSFRGNSTFTLTKRGSYPTPCLRKPPPPSHPMRRSPSSPRLAPASPLAISIPLGCGHRKLGLRVGGESTELVGQPITKPDTWSDHGVGYTNVAVSPLGEGLAAELLYDHSRYLLPDGTLRGRLEARFVKVESSKGCIVC